MCELFAMSARKQTSVNTLLERLAVMSRRGNVHDNAVAEAFNSTFKTECGERFESNEVAAVETFDILPPRRRSPHARAPFRRTDGR